MSTNPKRFTKEQLATMTREQKQRLLDLVAEKKKRAKEQRAVFQPNAGQLPVLLSDKRIRAVFAGNGGGKTALGVNIVLAVANGFDPWRGIHTPVPARIIVVLDKPDKIEQTWLPELAKWTNLRPDQLHKDGKPYIARITFPNGSFIKYMFHEQEAMSFESVEADLFVFDEPPPRHVFVGLRRGGRTKGRPARFVIIGTPLAAPWLRTDIYEPWSKGEAPDVDCFRFGTDVNKNNLDWEGVQAFFSSLSEKERRIRQEGEFFDLDGLALNHLFRRESHILRRDSYVFDKGNPCVVAIDPHPNKKHVAVLIGADDYGPVYLKELALKATPRDFARELKRWYAGHRLIDVICDSLGNADMTGGEGFKSFIQILREEGVPVRATTFEDKSDESWIQRIQDVLQMPTEANNFGQRVPKLRVLEGNVGIIGDIETVQWVKVRNLDEYKPKLDIGQKDFLACLKYALATHLHKDKPAHSRPLYRRDNPYGLPRAQSGKMNLRRHWKQAKGGRPVADDDDD